MLGAKRAHPDGVALQRRVFRRLRFASPVALYAEACRAVDHGVVPMALRASGNRIAADRTELGYPVAGLAVVSHDFPQAVRRAFLNTARVFALVSG